MFEEDLQESRDDFPLEDARERREYLEDVVTTGCTDLDFPCIPLHMLVWQFAELLGTYYIAKGCIDYPFRHRYYNLPEGVKPDKETAEANIRRLDDAQEVLRLFDEALARDDWVDDMFVGRGKHSRKKACQFTKTFIPERRLLVGTEEILLRMPSAQDSNALPNQADFLPQREELTESTDNLRPPIPPLSPVSGKMVIRVGEEHSPSATSEPKRGYIGKRPDIVPIPRETIKRWKEKIDYLWFRRAMCRAGGARVVLRDREKYAELWKQAWKRKRERRPRGLGHVRGRGPLDNPPGSDWSTVSDDYRFSGSTTFSLEN